MLFVQYFKTLVEKQTRVTVELKNDLQITGALISVDQYLNIKLSHVSVSDPERYPHLLNVKNCFVRGSVVRYIHLATGDVDTDLLTDQCRREIAMTTGVGKKEEGKA